MLTALELESFKGVAADSASSSLRSPLSSGRTVPGRAASSEALVHLHEHCSEAVLSRGSPEDTRFVVFDLRAGVAHVVHRASSARSSLSLLHAYAAGGRRLGPLLDWVETWL
jgi:hypothetical protein